MAESAGKAEHASDPNSTIRVEIAVLRLPVLLPKTWTGWDY